MCRHPTSIGGIPDVDFGTWVAPFVMSGINTRIVHRTNALSGRAYAPTFTYDEAMLMGRGLKVGRCHRMAAGLAGFIARGCHPSGARGTRALRAAQARRGPEPDVARKGFFDLRFFARRRRAARYAPGHGPTAIQARLDRQKMLGQAAACSRSTSTRPHVRRFWTARHDLRATD